MQRPLQVKSVVQDIVQITGLSSLLRLALPFEVWTVWTEHIHLTRCIVTESSVANDLQVTNFNLNRITHKRRSATLSTYYMLCS